MLGGEHASKGTDFFTVRNGQLMELDPLAPGQRHFATSVRSRQHVWPIFKSVASHLQKSMGRSQKVRVLEIGAGTGAHAEYFLQQPGGEQLVWQPTDYEFRGATFNPDVSSWQLAQRNRLLPLLVPFDAANSQTWESIAQEISSARNRHRRLSLSLIFGLAIAPVIVTIMCRRATRQISAWMASSACTCLALLFGCVWACRDYRYKSRHCMEFHLVYAASLVHMCPWACTKELFIGCSKTLGVGGAIVLYGPFRDTREGCPTSGEFKTLVMDKELDEEIMVTGFRSEGDANFHRLLREEKDATWGFRDVKQLVEIGALAGFDLEGAHDVGPNNFLLHFAKNSSTVSPQALAMIRSLAAS